MSEKKFNCQCGAVIFPACKSVHFNTSKHLNYLKSKGIETKKELPKWVEARKIYQKEYNQKHSQLTYCELCCKNIKAWGQHLNSKSHKYRAMCQNTVDYVVDKVIPEMIDVLEKMDSKIESVN